MGQKESDSESSRSTFQPGVNQFSDWTADERDDILSSKPRKAVIGDEVEESDGAEEKSP
ncbi:hypothetical protein ACF09C_22635 [Streptomyces sp. NPDC014870]|uniref:hypothetical protein n=1 Tax=Streptomyces sp. NPDC014870 TaxID=3364925 RepID=UPI0036F5C813